MGQVERTEEGKKMGFLRRLSFILSYMVCSVPVSVVDCGNEGMVVLTVASRTMPAIILRARKA